VVLERKWWFWNGSGGSGTEVVMELATSGNLNLKTESLMG